MNRTNRTQSISESAYFKSLRRRAERVILATAVYDETMRREVQHALDHDRSRLRSLLQECDRLFEEYKRRSKERHKLVTQAVKKITRKTKRKTKYFDVTEILSDAVDATWIISASDFENHRIEAGDYLLCDRNPEKQVKPSDLVAWKAETRRGVIVGVEQDRDGRDRIGVITSLIRRYDIRRRKRQTKTCSAAHIQRDEAAIASVRRKLDRLERLPENETEYFRLQTELFNLEHASDNTAQWPEVIGGAI